MSPPSFLRHLLPLALLLVALLPSGLCSFDTSDYDSYGVKLAGNDWVAAALTNAEVGGYINIYSGYQYPFNTTGGAEYYCAAYLDSSNTAWQGSGYAVAGWQMFAYGVAVGSRDSVKQSVVWWGENENRLGGGVNWNMQGAKPAAVSTVAAYQTVNVNVSQPFQCNINGGFTFDPNTGVPATLNVTEGGHEEFYQLAVQPEGNYAIGIANTFGYILDLDTYTLNGDNPGLQESNIHTLWSNASVSPLYLQSNFPSSPAFTSTNLDATTFGPRSMALETNWGVVAGWSQDAATKNWYATLLLFSHHATSVTLVDRWLFMPVSGTAQASVQVGDASSWKPKHDISVAVRKDGGILLGIQVFNTVWLFRTDGTRLILEGTNSKTAKQIGFGKTVSWTKNGTAAQILHNTYSADYTTVITSSVVEVYPLAAFTAAAPNGSWSSAAVAEWLYPGPTQQLSELVFPNFVNVLSTPSNLIIMDTSGNSMFIQSSKPGYFQPTITGYDQPLMCPPGMFNDESSYESCKLCPVNTYNPGTSAAFECSACPNNTYCPIGAVYPVNTSILTGTSQTFVYPSSPESIIFDDILIKNVFFLHGPSHCVTASPIFWGLIVFAILMLILGCMLRLKYCVNNARSKKIRRFTKFIFRRADLVKEGEHWIGGLISLVLLVLIIMGVWFTATYLSQYPYETASNPNFACGSQWNAKFSSELRSVALPADHQFSTMYDMLSEQSLTLGLDVINTNVTCDAVTATAIVGSGSTSTPVSAFTCVVREPGSISIETVLPSHTSTLAFTLAGAQLVGGVRLSISGEAEEEEEEEYVQNLRQVYASSSLQRADETLQKTTEMGITLTKVINVTDPLAEGDQGTVSGLWVPVFPSETDELFMSETAYLASTSSAFTISVSVSESLYWVANEQQPITRTAEAAFKTLLYIIMLLEVFGLAFLAAKLAQPCIHCAALRLKKKSVKKVWDKADSSDEEDWLADVLYGDNVKDVDRQEVLHVMHRAYTQQVEGLKDLTPREKEERARARQERREATKDSARGSRRVAPEHEQAAGMEMPIYTPPNPAVAATEV